MSLPEARFPGSTEPIPSSSAAPAAPLGEPSAATPGEQGAATPGQQAGGSGAARRWSGRTTALVAAGVLGLSVVGGVVAAAASPQGIAAPSDSRGGPGGPGGPAGPGGRGGFAPGQQGQPPGQQGQPPGQLPGGVGAPVPPGR